MLINIAAFNLIWLLLVGAAFNDWEMASFGVLAAWVAVHLRYSRYRRSDIRLIVVAALAGPAIDTLLLQLELVDYVGYAPLTGAAPLWVMALWINFALLPNHSLRFMRGRPWLAAATGALLAPLAYRGGAALGAAEFAQPQWHGLVALGLAWAIILPCLLALTAPANQARGANAA